MQKSVCEYIVPFSSGSEKLPGLSKKYNYVVILNKKFISPQISKSANIADIFKQKLSAILKPRFYVTIGI